MKKFFLLVIVMVIATMSFAQGSFLATLSHDGQISVYYGASALSQALEAADNGDVITLSSGQFTAADITKAVTIRGAGMSIKNDSISSHESTIIQGKFGISLSDSTTSKRLIIEGVYFTSTLSYKGCIRNPLFMKSRFESINIDGEGGTLVNSSFIHCRIADGFCLSSNSNACLINSVVWNPFNASQTGSNFEFNNCVICFTRSSSSYPYASGVINSYYKNSVIMVGYYAGNETKYSNNVIPPSCNAIYCVGCSEYGSAFSSMNNIFFKLGSTSFSNKIPSSYSVIFKTGTSKYRDGEVFILTDNAKEIYLCGDGKEVGIHGGNLPYEEDPITPQIIKCNVASKTTADGKLSVDIEVKAAE